MVAAQYTILSHILPGHQNWQELLGVGLVLLGSLLSYIYEAIVTPANNKSSDNTDDEESK